MGVQCVIWPPIEATKHILRKCCILVFNMSIATHTASDDPAEKDSVNSTSATAFTC